MRRHEAQLLAALRQGDERAFEQLVTLHHDALIRGARMYVRSHAAAEEVVQDAWAGALRNMPSFAGRSSLRTWLYRIMANQAIDYIRREARSLPFCAVEGLDGTLGDVDTRLSDGQRSAPWAAQIGETQPEARLLMAEDRRLVEAAIAALPRRQRLVITLRDVEGWSAEEAARALTISLNNQRVLLHRARAGVRRNLVESHGTEDVARSARAADAHLPGAGAVAAGYA